MKIWRFDTKTQKSGGSGPEPDRWYTVKECAHCSFVFSDLAHFVLIEILFRFQSLFVAAVFV